MSHSCPCLYGPAAFALPSTREAISQRRTKQGRAFFAWCGIGHGRARYEPMWGAFLWSVVTDKQTEQLSATSSYSGLLGRRKLPGRRRCNQDCRCRSSGAEPVHRLWSISANAAAVAAQLPHLHRLLPQLPLIASGFLPLSPTPRAETDLHSLSGGRLRHDFAFLSSAILTASTAPLAPMAVQGGEDVYVTVCFGRATGARVPPRPELQ